MPSALDLRLEAAYNLITGPGGPLPLMGRPLLGKDRATICFFLILD